MIKKFLENNYFKATLVLAFCFIIAVASFFVDVTKPKIQEQIEQTEPDYTKIFTLVSTLKGENNLWSDGAVAYAKNETATDVQFDNSNKDYSQTTTQVDGVSESDIVKTNGKYIFSFNSTKAKINIIKVAKEPEKMGEILFDGFDFYPISQMYLTNNKLIVMGHNTTGDQSFTKLRIYDVENPKAPLMLYECCQSGYYNDSRLVEDKLYLITNYAVNFSIADIARAESFVPYVKAVNVNGAVKPETIKISKNCDFAGYTVVCGYSITSGKLLGTQSVLGGTQTVYCSKENIITAAFTKDNLTPIVRFSLNEGRVKFEAEGEIKGALLNQFSIDEYKGNFRFVTTNNVDENNSLYVYNAKLEKIGAIENIAPNERVYSVRFMGDIAYFVTFRQVDPLFSVDLSKPRNPKIIGELKISGFSNYLYPFGENLLLGIGQEADEQTGKTGGVKLEIFNTSKLSHIKQVTKTVLEFNFSDALYSHKAAFIDAESKLVGFPVWHNKGYEYHLYRLENDAFTNVLKADFGRIFGDTRGIRIGKQFYVVAETKAMIFDFESYELLNTIEL